MFVPEKDERLNHIVLNAGLYAFLFNFFLILAVMTAKYLTDWTLLSNPDFLLIVPWLSSGLVFIGFQIKGGYYSVIREEASRTPQRILGARIEVLLYALGAGALMFLDKRVDLLDDSHSTLGEDLIDSAGFALILGVFLWFLQARKKKNVEDINQED